MKRRAVAASILAVLAIAGAVLVYWGTVTRECLDGPTVCMSFDCPCFRWSQPTRPDWALPAAIAIATLGLAASGALLARRPPGPRDP